MSNPNIRNLTSLVGNTAVANLTTAYGNVVENSAASNTIVKIVNFTASNITGNADASITLDLVRSGANYSVAYGVTVPQNATLVVLTKDAPLYLIEGDTLQCKASANSTVQVICSYEVIE